LCPGVTGTRHTCRILPDIKYNLDPTTITGWRGTGGVSAPQLTNQNAYDTISKALDIYGAVDTGIGISGVTLPALLQAGFIVAGALVATVAPAIGVGAAHNDALRKTSRDFFFDGFCRTLVMRADNWSTNTVEAYWPPLKDPPFNSVYKEKRESFRFLYNAGLKAGVLQARADERGGHKEPVRPASLKAQTVRLEEYPADVDEVQGWSPQKRKDYYGRLASILKDIILKKNLQVKFS
jgi:hypothetical protein